MTDLKDNHNSKLVNRVVEEVTDIAKLVPVFILMGNHDYVDPTNPYFDFLDRLNNITFVREPTGLSVAGAFTMFLPHNRHWRDGWEGLKLKPFHLVVLHQCITGAKGSGGHVMEGCPPVLFEPRRLRKGAVVVAGDIHVPQKVGNITYCGAPYPICFGDDYEPRVLLYDGKGLTSIKHTTLQKRVVPIEYGDKVDAELFRQAGLTEGDMVRVLLYLPRSEFGDWERYRRKVVKACTKAELVLCGVELKALEQQVAKVRDEPVLDGATPKQILVNYCKSHKVERSLRKAAEAFL